MNHAKAMPAMNKTVAGKRTSFTNFFSFAVRPGKANLINSYEMYGIEKISANIPATFMSVSMASNGEIVIIFSDVICAMYLNTVTEKDVVNPSFVVNGSVKKNTRKNATAMTAILFIDDTKSAISSKIS